jgi:hypothetical protein
MVDTMDSPGPTRNEEGIAQKNMAPTSMIRTLQHDAMKGFITGLRSSIARRCDPPPHV